jgi:hypothetical protein
MNWEANVAALAERQPRVVDAAGDFDETATWVFGRDGFLTAQDVLGRWWAGCSLPKRAGAAMLKRLDLRGVVGCLLAPAHAGQVSAALERIAPEQAIVVVQPEPSDLRVLLGCCDFSDDIRQNRLWFAAGADWPAVLAATFANHAGLPTPAQFIRTPATSEELVQQLIPVAEQAFNRVNDVRAAQVERARTREHQTSVEARRLLIVAGSHFRLWDDAGAALLNAMPPDGDGARHLDPDDPAQASATGLGLAASECDGVVLANRSRADLPDVLPASTAVLCWLTHPQIPAFDTAFSRDGLMLADDTWLAAARAAGWPEARLRVATWPAVPLPPAPPKAQLAMIADTNTLETPVTELDLSSHHLLWEMIRHDLARDPLSLGSDIDAFINRRMVSLDIAEEGFDRRRFVRQLVLPAYQQGLAKLLLDAGLPLKLYGRGWDALPELRDAWEGPIWTRDGLRRAVASVGALVYPWPVRYRHELDSFGRPVVWTGSRNTSEWIRQSGLALGQTPPPCPAVGAHLPGQIRSLFS